MVRHPQAQFERACNAELIESANDDLSTATIQNSQTARPNKKWLKPSMKSGQDQEDVDAFVGTLKTELMAAIEAGQKARVQ